VKEHDDKTFVVRQEPDVLARRRISAVAIGSVVIGALSLVVVDSMIGRGPRVRPPATIPAQVNTEPGARSAGESLGEREKKESTLILATERGITLRNEQRESLSHYSWVDRDAGVVRIPIERAIDLLAASPPAADQVSP
jgi:hypothetical protein